MNVKSKQQAIRYANINSQCLLNNMKSKTVSPAALLVHFYCEYSTFDLADFAAIEGCT